MLDKLKQYYGTVVTDTSEDTYALYRWYADTSGQKFGILKENLTKKDEALLSLFLTPLLEDDWSPAQKAWKSFLFQSASYPLTEAKAVRFLHFSLKQPFFEKQAWQEALSGLLSTEFIIVWKDDKTGVIIEQYLDTNVDVFLDKDAFQTLTSDFFITLHILVGKLRPVDNSLLFWFQWEHDGFLCTRKSHRHIMDLEDILPHFVIEKPDALLPVLQTVNDADLLHTVKMFLEANMNVSLAAKQQYMHRNSVQYRVDKFIEKTGIDIKNFKGAVAVYLSLCLYQ
ncbi:helix-turn-helix domain-containing protein [Ectobacillus sp. JY-23]|uniref:helix-turn-helix domain-containing protein n=1 Tax=Ectobacillus sp. JY-23 TaxID=2933872 RepID=UPI001FF19B6F|nr:helix-turn-helix domain-containing protein [Ectobacillus sp. JY-23]UOY92033.1 helix-turn-helix domain-containing protein [Ectobacillus sp. JY-23]